MSGAHGRRGFFVRSTVVAFWGHAPLLARITSSLSFTVLACSTSGAGGAFGAEGSWLLLVSRKSGCTSCCCFRVEGTFVAQGKVIHFVFHRVEGTFVAQAKVSHKSGCASVPAL